MFEEAVEGFIAGLCTLCLSFGSGALAWSFYQYWAK